MAFFTSPRSFQNAQSLTTRQFVAQTPVGMLQDVVGPHASHPPFMHLVILVFEAVLEVVCVSLPGYIAARVGMFDADAQKFVANLNVALFTPCLSMWPSYRLWDSSPDLILYEIVFTKLGSQLTAEKLSDLAIIPLIFIVQTAVSYFCGFVVSRCFRFNKRQSNFVAAMSVRCFELYSQ